MSRFQWRAAGLIVLCSSFTAQAGVFTLTDLNTTITVDTQSQAGFYDWLVDGQYQMTQQWFWLGVNGAAEFSIDQLTWVQEMVTNSNFNPGNEHLVVQYKNPGAGNLYTLELTATLAGGNLGCCTADLAEIIKVSNTSSQPISFRFYQYADFDLGATAGNDTVELLNQTTIYQHENPASIAEHIVADVPLPARAELDYFANTRNRLNDGVATDLAIDLTTTAYPVAVGPGDVTWAFQWNFTLQPGQSFLISKDKHLTIPEPASLGLLALGGLALLRRRVHG